MAYLVTGGCGFIGSNIAEELVNQGEKPRIIDNLSTGNAKNIVKIKDKVEFLGGSINDEELLKEALKDVDFVLHQAAIPSVPRSIENPLKTNKANVEGTLTLLNACRKSNVKRVVYASSSSVYGDTPTLPKVETMPSNPLSPYAAQKLIGEYYCKMFSQIYGLDTVSLRYFNVFGPKQDPNSQYAAVIPIFINAILNNKQPIIFGDGKTSRDFTFVKNVINGNILATKAKKLNGETINLACGDRITLLQLVETINKLLNKNIQPLFTEERPGDVKHSQADNTKARELLNFIPEVSFEEGLKQTIEWFKNGN